jgi:hypothetical protein
LGKFAVMTIATLRKFFTAPTAKAGSPQTIFWFSLSLTFAAVYGILCLRQSFGDYVVQDDARQHVFWMRRFLDPALFPNDLIADYFQSVAPPGYTFIYWLPAQFGIDPLLLNKFLPIVLGLVMTGYCFGVCLQILPVPFAGFAAAMLLNQTLWMKDGLASATPRAFACPLLLAFAYYLLRRALIPCLVAIALLGLIYPHNVFIVAGILILRLFRWQDQRLVFSPDSRDYRFCAIGLGVIFLVLLPYALQTSQFGPTITAADARYMPEFLRRGRTPFFHADPFEYWLFGRGSGFFPSSFPWLVLLGFLLPFLLRSPNRFPLVKHLHGVAILLQFLLASLGMFLLAHAVLFQLHLPNRYTGASLRLVIVLATGLVVPILLDAILSLCERRSFVPSSVGAIAATMIFAGALIFYPLFLDDFPNTRYLVGQVPSLYQFFAQKPKDTVVASLAEEADNLPTFARRMTLAGREYGVPFQVGYYRQLKQRAEAMIQAQYSPDPAVVKRVVQIYGIDFWLLDRAAFAPEYVAEHRWMRLFSSTPIALSYLQQGKQPALAATLPRCTAFETDSLVVLKADCIAAKPAQ